MKQEQCEVEFDVDAFLASIPKPPPQQTKLNVTRPQCSRCLVDMTFGVVVHEHGTKRKYRSHVTRFETKCYVTSGQEGLEDYLRAVDEQTHPYYTKIAPEKFKRECDLSMVLPLSKSHKNPGRLYLKCPKKTM